MALNSLKMGKLFWVDLGACLSPRCLLPAGPQNQMECCRGAALTATSRAPTPSAATRWSGQPWHRSGGATRSPAMHPPPQFCQLRPGGLICQMRISRGRGCRRRHRRQILPYSGQNLFSFQGFKVSRFLLPADLSDDKLRAGYLCRSVYGVL